MSHHMAFHIWLFVRDIDSPRARKEFNKVFVLPMVAQLTMYYLNKYFNSTGNRGMAVTE